MSSTRPFGMASPRRDRQDGRDRDREEHRAAGGFDRARVMFAPADDAAMIALAIAPKIATPTELPIERANRLVPVTTPRSFHGTLDWAAMRVGVATSPIPRPTMKQLIATKATLGCGDVRNEADGPDDRDAHAEQRGVAEADAQVEATGQGCADRPSEREGRDGEPGDDGDGADRPLEVGRHIRGEPDEHRTDAERDQRRRHQEPPREDPERAGRALPPAARRGRRR